MLAVSSTGWWLIGAVLAAAVVVIAAALLVLIITLARRIVRQAGEIVVALEGAREHTNPLFDVTKTNLAIDRITRDLRLVREGLERG